jgi:HAD superfamily hydrolase (TIGR01509 family)
MSSAVIFDLDGVIADTHPLHTRTWKQLLRERGREVSDEELSIIREGRKREEILRQFFRNLSTEEAASLGARKEELFQMSCGAIKPMSGLPQFLSQLEGFHIPKAVATSASKRRAFDILSRLHLIERFITVVTGDDVVQGKPNPSIFVLAAKHFVAAATDILVIEDSTAGVRAAKSAGMKCVGLASDFWAHQLYEAGADYVISSFSEVSWSDLCELMRCKAKTEQRIVEPN